MNIASSTVTITSFNAHAINDGTNYTARFPAKTPLLAQTDAQFVERPDEFPVYSFLRLRDRTLPIVITVKAGSIDTLKQWFDTSVKTAYKLLITDSSDSSTWYVYGVPTSFMVEGQPGHNKVTVILAVADPIWRKGSTTTEAWTVSSSGGTHTWTVAGTKYAKPVITITPNSARSGSGLQYKRWVAVYNQTTSAIANYPVNILSGNLDHAALVTAVKAQADGDDFRVFMDGLEVLNKWAGGGGYNSTTLRMWMNINLEPKIELTLGAAIAGAGSVTTITFEATAANQDALRRLATKDNKVLYIGTEAFAAPDMTVNILKYTVTASTNMRQAKGTSAASHSIGDTVRWIQHDIWVCYGDATLTAPTADDNLKPILNLTSSTNTSWVWNDFFSTGTLRTAQWSFRVVNSLNYKLATSDTRSLNYGATTAANADFSAIASVMGMGIRAANIAGTWRAETAEIEWKFNDPCGFTTITASGKKYRYSTSWPAVAGLQVSTNGTFWSSVWTEATPSTTVSWESLSSHSAVALGATYKTLRFVLQGSVTGTTSNAAYIEHDDITAVKDSNAIPSITLGSEQSDYQYDFILSNDTSGETLTIKWPSATSSALTIDCDRKTITTADGTNIRGAMKTNTVRKDWLTLTPGSTTFSYTESNLVGVGISVAYEEREL